MPQINSSLKLALSATAILFISLTSASAGTPAPDKTVVLPPAPVSESGWEFRVEPFFWATGLDGTVGAGALTTGIDIDFTSVLSHLDMAAMLQFEARKGRWGILTDGVYAKLGAVGGTPGELYSNYSADLRQAIVEVDLAYRIFEGPKGFVDLYAGARYNYLSLGINAQLDSQGVQQVSNQISQNIINDLTAKAQARLAQRKAEIQSEKSADKAKASATKSDYSSDFKQQLAHDLVKAHLAGLSDIKIARIAEGLRSEREALSAALAAQAEADKQAIAAAVSSKVQARVAQAQKNLAKAINKELLKNLPQSEYANEQWVDPLVGIRAQWNITDKFFAAFKGDIGGFGVSSELAWQLQGTLGYNFNKSVFTEIGYRYLSTDYERGLVYDVAESGLFMGLGFKL